ncbi:hypothetical protein AALP_AA3G022000 [Arabis alpina]|uniref:SURP motif domain-containing protein n=1 Tax=Arabis alpina TaxID=50452 RepID=A0A087H6I0_ARAAL|nr:hypothetical protein AALP_AA3G022000 [Arabis alpina]
MLLCGVIDCFANMEDDDYSASLPTQVRPLVLLERMQLGNTQPSLGSELTENQNGVQDIHECDVQPVLNPIWDPPLRRSSFVYGVPQRELSLKELGIIKLTAQFVARHGPYFCRDLMKTVEKDPQFNFMKSNGENFDFYNGLTASYTTVLRRSRKLRNSDAPTGTVLDGFFHHLQLEMLEEGVEMAIVDVHAFVAGVDCFAYMENEEYSSNLPLHEPFLVIMNRLTQMQPGFLEIDTTLKELGVIKLTAQFVARYGNHFSLALMKREDKNPQFEFMKPSDSISSPYSWFHLLVNAYSRVLRTSNQVSDACTAEIFIEIFLQGLQLEKLEQRVEMAMIDLHAFVSGVDCFADIEEDEEYSTYFPPPEHFSVMMNLVKHKFGFERCDQKHDCKHTKEFKD